MEEHRSIKKISVNGSFATIPFCTQMIADIFNKPVCVSGNMNSVSLGAFLLSATEMGIYKNLDEAARTIDLPVTYKPNKYNNSIYAKNFAIFEKLSTKLFDEFEEIANLQ